MIRTRLRSLVALVLVALAAGAIAARADSGGGSAPKARPVPSGPPPRVFFPKTPCAPSDTTSKPSGAPPSQALLNAFAILRRPAQASDALPAEALKALQRAGMAPVSPGAARLLRSTAAGGRAWVVPVPDVERGFPFLCRAQQAKRTPREGLAVIALGDAAQGGGGALDDLVRGRAPVSTDMCAGANHEMLSVSGIVPDGVAAVFLTAPDGTAVRADVKDNGYEFVVVHPRATQQRYVVWTGGDGTPHVQPIVASPTPRSRRLCAQVSKIASLQPRISPGPGSGICPPVPVPILSAPITPKTARALRRVRPARMPVPVTVYAAACPATPLVLAAPPAAVPKRHR
jgi:hypothetical protein